MVRSQWEFMTSQSNSLKRCFKNPSIIAYRRSKNLSDLLVRAKVSHRRSNRTSMHNGFKLCLGLCATCKHGEATRHTAFTTSTHSCKRTGQKWNITAPITCDTKNVIYKLSCRKCPDWVYIGETGRCFCDRFAEHRGYVSQKKLNQPTGHHFNQKGHSLSDLIALPFERVLPHGNIQLRKRREKLWIYNYNSVEFGANIRD